MYIVNTLLLFVYRCFVFWVEVVVVTNCTAALPCRRTCAGRDNIRFILLDRVHVVVVVEDSDDFLEPVRFGTMVVVLWMGKFGSIQPKREKYVTLSFWVSF